MGNQPSFHNIHQKFIDRCKKGDKKAQFAIYKLYYKSMYNTSLRILLNPEEAEDIMQESFLTAFQKIETYSGKVSFGAWLKKIVINNSLDALKKKKVQITTIDDKTIETNKEDESFYEQDLTDRIDEIRDAIQELPDGYRIVLSLYLLEGYDHDEISEILNISSSTSRSQLTRAKQKLIEILKQKNRNR